MKDENEDRETPIGNTIRALREQRLMRQSDLAKKTGMSAAQLCHIEKDRNVPSVRTLRRIADALGVPLSDLAWDGLGASSVEECALPSPTSFAPSCCCECADADYEAGNRVQMPSPSSPPSPVRSSGYRRPDRETRSVLSAPPDSSRFVESLSPVGEFSLDSLPVSTRRQVCQRINEYRDLEIRAGIPVLPSLPLNYPVEIQMQDADALARAVRHAGGIADAVLFDTIAFLEGKGLRVVMADLPEKVESFTFWDAGARNVWMVLRKASTDERQQFRSACELANVILFVTDGARAPVADTPNNRRFTREFASSFLMPGAALQEMCYRLGLTDESWTWDLLLREKQRYSVSAEAFVYRLEALSLLKPSLRQSLLRRIREWYETNGNKEPNPSYRNALRHSRFSDLKMLVAARDAALEG